MSGFWNHSILNEVFFLKNMTIAFVRVSSFCLIYLDIKVKFQKRQVCQKKKSTYLRVFYLQLSTHTILEYIDTYLVFFFLFDKHLSVTADCVLSCDMHFSN